MKIQLLSNEEKQKLKRIKEHPSQENLEQVKEFKNQEEFKTKEESLQTRIKIQDLKNQDQDSRLKIQE